MSVDMTRSLKLSITILVFAILLAAILVTFRLSLLRAGINSFLPEDTEVVSLEGLRLGTRRTQIDALEVALHASGQTLVVAGIDISYRRPGFFSMPLLEEVTISSARLLRDAPSAVAADDSIAGAISSDADRQSVAKLSISDLLQQLRDFPLQSLTLSQLDIPQLTRPVALHLDQTTRCTASQCSKRCAGSERGLHAG